MVKKGEILGLRPIFLLAVEGKAIPHFYWGFAAFIQDAWYQFRYSACLGNMSIPGIVFCTCGRFWLLLNSNKKGMSFQVA